VAADFARSQAPISWRAFPCRVRLRAGIAVAAAAEPLTLVRLGAGSRGEDRAARALGPSGPRRRGGLMRAGTDGPFSGAAAG
jgi:hypothetical protein